jgi:4-hydroxy-tetrahydrodipicolinate synthase
MPDAEVLSPRQRIRGVLAPVLTPFTQNLAPDRQRFIRHCRRLLAQNCGLAPFGTTSEANSMSAEERISLLEALLEAGLDPARVMPGTGCCSMPETVALTAHAVQCGCAGVLMLPPFYYKGICEEGLYRYFSEVVQRVGDARLRIYLYHIPPVTIVGITPKLVERLLRAYPNTIAGMKDSSGDWNNTKAFLGAFADTVVPGQTEFDVFVGSETFLLANMRHGGAGTISATANVNSSEICALFAQCLKNQESNLEQQQARLDAVREVFSSTNFPSIVAALKQAIAIYAKDSEWARVRPPLIELTSSQTKLLAAQLESIGFAMTGIAPA